MKRRIIYTLPAGTNLTPTRIKRFISFHKNRYAPDYKRLDSYLSEAPESGRPAPSKVLAINNYAQYIVSTNSAYLVGTPVKYKHEDDEKAIKPLIDLYEDQTISDLDSELAEDCSAFGRAYELVYRIAQGEKATTLRSAKLSVFNTIVIYDDTVQHNPMYAITFTPATTPAGNPKEDDYNLTIWDDKYERKIRFTGGKIVKEDVEEHHYGAVPVIEYANNKRFIGDYERVLSLIDAYNFLQSDRLIDREKLVDALLAISGAKLTEKDRQAIKDNRVIGLPADSTIQYVIKNIDEADADVLRQTIAADIHKFSMTPDLSDKDFAGNSSGVAIRYKLLGLDQNTAIKERYFKKGLTQRLEIYMNYLEFTNKMKHVPLHEIDIVFNRNLPVNELEISQMITNLDGKVDDETLLGRLPWIDNPTQAVLRAKQQKQENIDAIKGKFGTDNEDENDDDDGLESL